MMNKLREGMKERKRKRKRKRQMQSVKEEIVCGEQGIGKRRPS